MDPEDRIQVAQSGGCGAILDAMSMFIDDDELQVMALGALKALSFSPQSKEILRSKKAVDTVANVMQKHVYKPVIQSEGCIVLSDLAVNDADQSINPVSEQAISVIVNGILANPDALDVHEAAVFALVRLSSSAVNVDLICRNSVVRYSLELALGKNPDKVTNNVRILLRRLGSQSFVLDWAAPYINSIWERS